MLFLGLQDDPWHTRNKEVLIRFPRANGCWKISNGENLISVPALITNSIPLKFTRKLLNNPTHTHTHTVARERSCKHHRNIKRAPRCGLNARRLQPTFVRVSMAYSGRDLRVPRHFPLFTLSAEASELTSARARIKSRQNSDTPDTSEPSRVVTTGHIVPVGKAHTCSNTCRRFTSVPWATINSERETTVVQAESR